MGIGVLKKTYNFNLEYYEVEKMGQYNSPSYCWF